MGEGDYAVKWFQGKHNVTHDVRSSGREFTLQGNGSKVFRIQLNPKVNNPDPYCVVGDFNRVSDMFGQTGYIAINNQSACV